MQRINKLVVNGWDDANGDNKRAVPRTSAPAAACRWPSARSPASCRIAADEGDRDHDCVPEVSAAKLPAALAGQVVFKRR